MKNRTKQYVVLALGAVALASPLLAFASAQAIGQVANNVSGNFSDLSRFLTGGAYVTGAAGIFHGIHKFWQKSHDQGNQVKASHYMIPALAGGAFIAVAATAGVPVATLFGGGVNSSGAGDSGTTSY
ncbi:hypothetical protein [Acidithiobacillus ferriphilus]|uniref:hypothetical protein n=1 Tax=Acidithiobacillus ferriphilus TaxID=1689834 RepID=UPI001C078F84|nr:hypothetical protein [Acidithiobacillus ferriphilus]MBU2853442.1 hypothetical protein [Acidithiobacillus ferriphilus]